MLLRDFQSLIKNTSIENDYKIKKTIGHGANGEVFLCKNKKDKQLYALKILPKNELSQNEIKLQLFTSEKCNHIVGIKDLYLNENKFYVVLEYMEGGQLFDKIIKKKSFSEREAAKTMYEICIALNCLHSNGIAHRDLKPENLLYQSKKANSIIKLADFGFAKEVKNGLSSIKYTPSYVSPEILSFKKYDLSCDIWSLGVIMYILCCGYPPFYNGNGNLLSAKMIKKIKTADYEFPEEEWSNISQDAKDLIAGMLKVNPAERLKIDDIIKSDWISHYLKTPKNELKTHQKLKEIDSDELKFKIDNLMNHAKFDEKTNHLDKLKQFMKHIIKDNLDQNFDKSDIRLKSFKLLNKLKSNQDVDMSNTNLNQELKQNIDVFTNFTALMMLQFDSKNNQMMVL